MIPSPLFLRRPIYYSFSVLLMLMSRGREWSAKMLFNRNAGWHRDHDYPWAIASLPIFFLLTSGASLFFLERKSFSVNHCITEILYICHSSLYCVCPFPIRKCTDKYSMWQDGVLCYAQVITRLVCCLVFAVLSVCEFAPSSLDTRKATMRVSEFRPVVAIPPPPPPPAQRWTFTLLRGSRRPACSIIGQASQFICKGDQAINTVGKYFYICSY